MTRDYFYRLHAHHRPVNDLSTAVKLTNRLLRFWADGGFVYYKRVRSPFFRLVPIPYCYITSWFAIALTEIRTRRILREKASCKQSNTEFKHLTPEIVANILRIERDGISTIKFQASTSPFK